MNVADEEYSPWNGDPWNMKFKQQIYNNAVQIGSDES